MPTVTDIIKQLQALGSEENPQGLARYGINVDKAFGVKMGAGQTAHTVTETRCTPTKSIATGGSPSTSRQRAIAS